MSLLRGNLPQGFFEAMEAYLANWGAQYFFASFFNQKLGGHLIIELLERLEDIYGVCFNKNLDSFAFHVSGRDSVLSYRLNDRFTDIFPFKDLKRDVQSLIAFSDLCLVVDNSFNGGSVAIFGEVEGTYGNKFRSQVYWGSKQEFCVFGIGTVAGGQKQIWFEESRREGVDRVVLMIEKSHFIVTDFLQTIRCLKWLFSFGPSFKDFAGDEEFRWFANQMRERWSDPIETVFRFLESFIDGGDLVGFVESDIKIITDIQAI
ncbi:hypothetical protein [Pseudomonas aeruginosa]|uniref:hypothetical protein n=1 Tax=Pseudomonas aeruginosa TaxID=287 RepID=UPI001495BF53|nr:hypothetical protein [Pseudomonas aeruginosa]MDG3700031.1 hypothetical protein [Pseudomonas aeruginosa]NPS65172.1 hypothetical protein [Pseudomonas aeruginosa]